MNRRYLMMASSVFTGALGLTASFLPDEILKYIGLSPTALLTLFVQVTGALYTGFAIMNWMAKGVLIGGIYARPLAMGNFAHFMMGAIVLVKAGLHKPISPYLWVIAVFYSGFALLFGFVLFTHPAKQKVMSQNIA